MSPALHPPARRTQGFTLFEVALSLGLMAFGVVSVLMFFPMGLKAQQLARFKVLASAKALEVVDAYNTFHNANPASDFEAPNLWDVHTTYKSQAPDLESRVSSYRNGLLPLPLDIARRLDSDGDEIQALLGQGAYLYYSQPLATTGLKESAFGTADAPNDAQRLVMAVVGFPQNNAIQTLPAKAWPYYTAYPSPPVHFDHGADDLGAVTKWDGDRNAYLWEDIDQNDTDMTKVFLAYEAYDKAPDKDKARAYATAAVDYCVIKGLSASFFNGSTKVTTFDPNGPQGDRLHLQVSGLRFLAHAANCAWKWGADAPAQPAGPTPPLMVGTATQMELNETTVRTLHDNCLTIGMLFQSSHPYDWGCPRPLQRAIMMDFPLIEFDLASQALTGPIFSNRAQARQWRAVSAQPLTNLGRSSSFPNPGALAKYALGTRSDLGDPATVWGDPTHTTLTARFSAAERCRQLVFWAVDWQSYEDFESAPSAPVDASKYPKGAPRTGQDLPWCMNHPGLMDWQQFSYRNPEKTMVFLDGLRQTIAHNDDGTDGVGTTAPAVTGGVHDQGTSASAKAVFSGIYGADRNANGSYDRGTLPPSVRLRAITVARFNYYDLRVPAVLR